MTKNRSAPFEAAKALLKTLGSMGSPNCTTEGRTGFPHSQYGGMLLRGVSGRSTEVPHLVHLPLDIVP